MVTKFRRGVLPLLLLTCLLPQLALAQTRASNPIQSAASNEQSDKVRQADLLEVERRTFAIASVTSLADEARSYPDLPLRTRVLARVADTLWDADGDKSRLLFRRAWEAAEEADTQEPSAKAKENMPAVVIALTRISGRDLRMEVLSLAARRDPALGEEFLAKLNDENTRSLNDTRNDASQRSADSWSVSEQETKRLLLAHKLLDDGEPELALEIATPALNQVNVHSIGFLSELREKRRDIADGKFQLLLTRAELDPGSDANTVSGLSSYILTPGVYVTFSPDGGSRWTQPDATTAAPDVPASLRQRFFQIAASILLRPSPPPDQDFSSTGRIGKSLVIKRLLPFFDRAAPDTAAALRAQLTTITSDLPRSAVREENPGLNYGINPTGESGDPLQRMQEQLDRAKSSRERDEVYSEAAVTLSHQGDSRARDLADKIEDPARRSQLQRYVDLQFVQLAIDKKEASKVIQLARAGQLTSTQRVWAYTQAAKLLKDSEQRSAIELLEEGGREARRIPADDPDRARSLIAVATHFVAVDQVRAWELMAEAVKAANAVEKFTGENERLVFALLVTRGGVKTVNIRAEDFALAGLIRALTEADLTRTVDLAKSFKNVAPRANAILTMAHTVLNKKASSPQAKKL